jgi:glycerophosphoryl diester phosphodiesterase
VERTTGTPAGPFVVAHRSGNSLSALRDAEALGVRTIEADVHLCRGRLEVRHLKTLGPVPLLWDRWKLASPWAPRLLVSELLEAVRPPTELVLDLKGRDRRLAGLVLEAIGPRVAEGRDVTVCARSWPLLEPFTGVEHVRVVHSVGSARQLARLRRRLDGRRIQGISIHERVLDSGRVRELRELADLILTWPVNTVERARELAGWGVDGLISDRPDVVRAETL